MTYSGGWEKFVETTAINNVRLPIAASWQRSLSAVSGTSGRGRTEPGADDEFVRAATRALHRSEDALANTTTWVALSDPRGVVIYEWWSTTELKHRLQRAEVSTGAVLDEPHAGTNGIGLALATRRPSVVSGGEHFNPAWSNFVCAAAPLRHPLTQEFLGIANITSLVDGEHTHVKITLNSVLAGIRQVLTAGVRGRHQRLLDAHLRVCSGTLLSVVTLDEHMMIVEDPRQRVAFDRGELWNLLQRAGATATRLTLPSGQAVQVIPIDPSDATAGCSLVFGSRAATRPRRDEFPTVGAGVLGPIEQAEHDVIVSVLRDVDGNKSLAAGRLRISRGTLYERIRRYHIDSL